MKQVAIDPAFRNVGIVEAEGGIPIQLHLITTKKGSSPVTTDDFVNAQLIWQSLQPFMDYIIIFEMPMGSLRARSLKLLSIVIGIMACLPNTRFVTPRQVKSVVDIKATKEDMVNWAVNKYPNLNWKDFPKSKWEHLADALAVLEYYNHHDK